MKITCEVKKMISKAGKEYFVLYITDLDKNVFLSNTEVKLLKLMYPQGN